METPIIDYSKEMKEEEKKELKKDTSIVLNTPFMRFVYNVVEPWSEITNGQLLTEEAYNNLKVEVDEYSKMKILYMVFPVLVSSLVSFIVFYYMFVVRFIYYIYNRGIHPLVLVIICTTLVALVTFWIIEWPMSKKRKKLRAYELTYAQIEAEEDPFRNSIKTSYKYLDRYYDQTQQQAKNGFHITMCVAIFGAGLIAVGVWLLFSGANEKITPAYITCASGVITEFISSIFFAMYNKTITSMNSYHDKLVLSQNIAFALRVAGEMEGTKEKNKAKLAIINELVKDVNAQMMKSDADDTEPLKKKPSPDAETPSGNE